MHRFVVCLALIAAFCAPVLAEDEPAPEPPAEEKPPKKDWVNPGTPLGAAREQMWAAPSAADWQKPCLMTWQRTWEDAVAVAKQTGRPILICINMDGEIASEHYAGVRYRQPEIAAIYEPYVTVVASVYRHTPRDYDDEGNRIPCPRFGGVTCGEHIKLEATVYDKYLDGERVAPRHIAVTPDGKEIYDVYYANDTASVFEKIHDTVEELPAPSPTVVRGDRPIVERVGSRDVRDRGAVEKAYREGDAAMRKALLQAADQHKDKGQLELLRLALFGLDADASKAARTQLSQATSSDATELISEALQTPTDASERDALIGALKRLGGNSKLARWLSVVHSGLSGGGKIDLAGWIAAQSKGRPQYTGPGRDLDALEARIEQRAKEAKTGAQDTTSRLDLAEAALTLALDAPKNYPLNPRRARMVARHMFGYAREAIAEAQALGAASWRVAALEALTAYYSGDTQAGYELSEKAVPGIPAGDGSWSSMAVLTVFGEARWKAIKAKVRAKEDWSPQWLADLDSAYSILRRHPLGTDGQVLWHYDLLVWLRARQRATRVLYDGIAQFRDSIELHKRLREHLLKYRGPAALEHAYERLLEKHDDPSRLGAFAGYASMEAANQYRRMRRYPRALKSYDRALGLYARAVEADARHKSHADVAVALIHAGKARVHFQLTDDEKALAAILASFERHPGSAGTRDALGVTPGETAQVLLSRLQGAKNEAAVAKLKAALAKLDPKLLRPDVGLMPGR